MNRKKTGDEDDFDIFDLPSITPSFFNNDRVSQPRAKVPVTLQVDPDLLSWFRAQGPGWETKMVAALRQYMDAKLKR